MALLSTSSLAEGPIYATPVSGLTTDGRLEDWPASMPAYPFDEASSLHPHLPPPVDEPGDYPGRLHVGFDESAQRLHLAVIVEDDEVGLPGHGQDLCYVALTGPGEVLRAFPQRSFHMLIAEAGAVPRLVRTDTTGPPAITDMKGAVTRRGGVTVYEWGASLRATWGDTVALYLSIWDADGSERGTVRGLRGADRSGIVDLVLTRRSRVPAAHVNPWTSGDPPTVRLAGAVTGPDAVSAADVPLAIRRGTKVAAAVRSDSAGRFVVDLLPGDYSLEVVPGFGFEAGHAVAASIAEGEVASVEVRVSPLHVPEALRRSAERYATLDRYRDTARKREQTFQGFVQGSGTRERSLVFERPHRVRLTTTGQHREEVVVVSDGDSVTTLQGVDYSRGAVPEDLYYGLTSMMMSRGAFVEGLVLQLLVADDPLDVLVRDTIRIRSAGEVMVEETPTWLFELERSRKAGPGYSTSRTRAGTVLVQVWVGQQDHLIRQVVREDSLAADPRARREAGFRRVTWLYRDVQTGGPLPEGTFTLELPEGARRVGHVDVRAQLRERFGNR